MVVNVTVKRPNLIGPGMKRLGCDSPGRLGKMWCVGKLDEEYIAKMEDMLKIYERPLSKSEPVVCVDEKAGGSA